MVCSCGWGIEVCREIDDKFTMNDEIVGRFFEVPGKHFCESHRVVSEGQRANIEASTYDLERTRSQPHLPHEH